MISRGSAMQFGGSNRPSTPEIAKLLDVDAIVEGSVMRSGDTVRINAQLIDARADRHLWSQSFERSRATCSHCRRSWHRPSPTRSTCS